MNSMWQKVLTDISARPILLARFLNSISLMEYMGARKIMKSQHEKDMTEKVLAHIAEEVRHAQIFKKMALRLSDGQLSTYNDEHLLAGAESRAYIQAVDQSVFAALSKKDTYTNYLLSTLIIEERASQAYAFWVEPMSKIGLDSHLRKILKEEEVHLTNVIEDLKAQGHLTDEKMEHLRKCEEEAFNQLIEALAQGLEADKATESRIHSEALSL